MEEVVLLSVIVAGFDRSENYGSLRTMEMNSHTASSLEIKN